MLNGDNWSEDWGGGTLILDSLKTIPYQSSPDISTFKLVAEANTFNNYSLLFELSDRSWHALSALKCPRLSDVCGP